MKKLILSAFDINKIGDAKQLNQIIGGGNTYIQTGSGSHSNGSTYRDFRGDKGGNDHCDVADGRTPHE